MTDEQTTDPESFGPKDPDHGNGQSPNTDEPSDVGTSDGNGHVSTTDELTGSGQSDDPDTFPREYVERLRDENARYRTRAQTADEAAQRLLAATIASTTTGILADPSDLPAGDYLDADGWPDPDLIRTAANELVGQKPHLGDRRPRGSIGQGAASEAGTVDLAGILRSRA